MITVHNLQGHAMAINGALIERVDSGPESHLMLSNGTSYVVQEPIEEIVRLHREDRAIVQLLAFEMTAPRDTPGPGAGGAPKDGLLHLVTPALDKDGGVRL